MNNIPKVPIIYPGKLPDDYINDVHGWAFSKNYLIKNLGKLLTLDIDFGEKCSLNCPHCFRKHNDADKYKAKMTYNELIRIIEEAKKLGLKSIKFLGKGEPFENGKLIQLLIFLKKRNIIPLIFTKGHVIGSDELVKKYHAHYGIKTGKQLVKKLKELDVSILLGFNSFNQQIQNHMVGDDKKLHLTKNKSETYTDLRNKALELLVNEGFNDLDEYKVTRLCLATNPVTKENYDEIFKIYKWGRERNMYVIVTPTMISGRGRNWQKITPTSKKLIDLYTNIYIYNINKNIQTLNQVFREGIASYAGGHPCNQIACGMYITIHGTVLRCPGDDFTILGYVIGKKKKSLNEIWESSENYGRAGRFNCKCPPKWEKSIPTNLFTQVLINLKNYFQNKKFGEN